MTTMRTEDLISELAAKASPAVRRLRPPSGRVMLWLAVSMPWVAFVVGAMGMRPDLALKFEDTRWVLEQAAALTTAVTAAMAAFCAGVPGRPRWEHALPAIPLLVWLGLLLDGCLGVWMAAGPAGLSLAQDWECLPAIVMVGFVPAIAMALMLYRTAPMAPMLSVGLGGLAAGGLGNFGLRLFHIQDASLMVLVWQLGTVALLTATSAGLGHRIVRWRHLSSDPQGPRYVGEP
jgi:hypothetical protein